MIKWESLKQIIDLIPVKIRFIYYYKPIGVENKSIEVGCWNTTFGIPAESYVEADGPVLNSDVVFIDIDPIEEKHLGRLLPKKIIDHTSKVVEMLEKENIHFKENEGNIRISCQ